MFSPILINTSNNLLIITKRKYLQDASLGLNLAAPQNDPRPKPTLSRKGNHGTNCAGIIAMRAGNMICGVGIAPLVTFGGTCKLFYFVLIGGQIQKRDTILKNMFFFF